MVANLESHYYYFKKQTGTVTRGCKKFRDKAIYEVRWSTLSSFAVVFGIEWWSSPH
jgi:hypothetical protein